MSVKYLYNESKIVQERGLSTLGDQTCSGRATNRNLNYFAYTDAVRHRPFPFVMLPTPLSFTERQDDESQPWECGKHTPSSLSWRSGSHSYCHNVAGYDLPATNVSVSSNSSNVQNRAITAGQRATVNMGENLGSVKETGKMILARARSIGHLMLAIHRKQEAAVAAYLKQPLSQHQRHLLNRGDFANLYLELIFGWLPVIQDVYNGLEMLDGSLSRSRSLRVGSARDGTFDSPRNHAGWVGQGVNLRLERQGGPAASAVSYVSFGGGQRQLSQLGLGNPALLAWQLLPKSFIVDWFYSVSDVLALLSYGIPGVLSGVVCKTTENVSYTRVNCGRIQSYRRSVNRTVTPLLGSFSFAPSPRNLGLWHAATAAALVEQRFHNR